MTMTFMKRLEEILVMGDIGIRATEEIIENLKQKVKENHIKEPADCRGTADQQYQRADVCR